MDPGADEVFTTTVIRVLPDGSIDVTEQEITAGEQASMVEARRAALSGEDGATIGTKQQAVMTVDGGCSDSSLWLFDQKGMRGNMLCLFGTKWGGVQADLFFLGSATRYWVTKSLRIGTDTFWWSEPVSWRYSVQSYWAGSERGWGLARDYLNYGENPATRPPTTSARFSAWERCDDWEICTLWGKDRPNSWTSIWLEGQ